MSSQELYHSIVRTLVYYDIFEHPLTERELFCLMPQNSLTPSEFHSELLKFKENQSLICEAALYSLPDHPALAGKRKQRERLALKHMRIARLITHIIKRFPFVRGIALSGDISKGVADPDSDLDFVIITAPGRLWICRSLLILFKKVILFNSKKYFCLNYFVDEHHLKVDEQNYYTATEIAHLKSLYNSPLLLRYLNSNSWIRKYFPNYHHHTLNPFSANNRRSHLQAILETPLKARIFDRLEVKLMEMMHHVWEKRYPEFDRTTRESIFKTTAWESRAYVGNFSEKILTLYHEKLQRSNLLS